MSVLSSTTNGYFPSGGSTSRSSSLPPPLRKQSTGSFSRLEDFRLDGPPSPDEDELEVEEGSEAVKGSGVKGVRHVELAIDAG